MTKTTLAKLKAPHPSGRQTLYWDAELRGFGVLCSGSTNSRTYVAQRDLPDGRTRRVTIAAVNEVGLEEARDAAATLLADIRAGRDPKERKQAPVTLRTALDAYLAKKTLAPATLTDYRASAERHLAPWLDLPLAEITHAMVEARHQDIAAEVAAGGRYPGGSTADGAMRVLKLLWRYAARSDRTLPPCPVDLRGLWYAPPCRDRQLHPSQMPPFRAAVETLMNTVARDYILFLLFTGLRRREAASLKWDMVDFAERVVRLPGASTKSGRKLDLPMTSFVFDLLVARRAQGRGDFVFPASGKSGHIAEPKFPLRAVAAECGTYVSAHDLRRTFVTVAESCDISYSSLKALVNHSLGKSDVTAGYIQMTTERLREPAQRVCDRLMVLCGIEPPAGASKIAR